MPLPERAAPSSKKGALKLTLLPPETVPMTQEQHDEAVRVLASIIVDWLRRRRSEDSSEPTGSDDRRRESAGEVIDVMPEQ
jgi:hypothetical protein